MDEPVIDATASGEGTTGQTEDALRRELAERDAELLARSESEQAMLARYRDVLLASDPDVDGQLVTGDTLAEIDRTFDLAREMADRIRGNLGPGMQRISPGAPGRRPPSYTTPFEKIREGLARRAG